MKKLVGAVSAVGVAAAGMALAPPAMATVDPGNGPATVVLTKCATGGNPVATFDPACSYLYLTPRGFSTYPFVNLTAPGPVTWDSGNMLDGGLAFPASGQTWQEIEKLPQGTKLRVNPVDITGRVDGSGVVTMEVPYALTFELSGQICEVTGTVDLSSAGRDSLGTATGKNWDPATGAFAVAGTSAAPSLSGACTKVQTEAFDVSQPIGFYFVGTMTLPPPDAAQTATPKVAKKVKKSGKSVLLKRAVVTNIGQKATAKVTWSPKKNAKGKKAKYAKLTTKKSGKLVLTTKGASKKLFVKLTLKAPAKPGYKAYSYTKVWKVK